MRTFLQYSLIVLLVVGVGAQNLNNRFFTTFAHEQLTVTTAAVGFTAATYDTASARAQLATFTVSGCIIRVKTSGTNPTSTVGRTLAVGSNPRIYGYDDIRHAKFIRDSSCSVNGTLDVDYGR